MSLKVTEDAIQATKTLKTRTIELHKDLLTAVKNLATTFDENQGGLGYHSSSIKDLLEELDNEGTASGAPVKVLTKRLDNSAKIRRAHMDVNSYRKR